MSGHRLTLRGVLSSEPPKIGPGLPVAARSPPTPHNSPVSWSSCLQGASWAFFGQPNNPSRASTSPSFCGTGAGQGGTGQAESGFCSMLSMVLFIFLIIRDKRDNPKTVLPSSENKKGKTYTIRGEYGSSLVPLVPVIQKIAKPLANIDESRCWPGLSRGVSRKRLKLK